VPKITTNTKKSIFLMTAPGANRVFGVFSLYFLVEAGPVEWLHDLTIRPIGGCVLKILPPGQEFKSRN